VNRLWVGRDPSAHTDKRRCTVLIIGPPFGFVELYGRPIGRFCTRRMYPFVFLLDCCHRPQPFLLRDVLRERLTRCWGLKPRQNFERRNGLNWGQGTKSVWRTRKETQPRTLKINIPGSDRGMPSIDRNPVRNSLWSNTIGTIGDILGWRPWSTEPELHAPMDKHADAKKDTVHRHTGFDKHRETLAKKQFRLEMLKAEKVPQTRPVHRYAGPDQLNYPKMGHAEAGFTTSDGRFQHITDPSKPSGCLIWDGNWGGENDRVMSWHQRANSNLHRSPDRIGASGNEYIPPYQHRETSFEPWSWNDRSASRRPHPYRR
jgi:hypothetical protein